MISEVYTCTTWNLCEDIIVHYTRTTWLSLHLYNLISGFYTCTTWNFYLYGKVTYFTLHSHTLILFTVAKNDFWGFFILVCVCFLTYTYFVLIFMSKLSRSLFMDSYFYLFIRLLLALFLFYVKKKAKQDQTVL